MRSRKWANHNTYDRLPGRPLGLSGENVSGECAARCKVGLEGSDRSCLLGSGGRRQQVKAGRGEKWAVESELRPYMYGCLQACISLANTHPTQAASTEGSVARRRALTKRQSAKGTPALAYEHHQAWSERLCTGTLTTAPLLCPHRLALPPRPWYCLARSPVLRAHAPVCLQHPRAALLARLQTVVVLVLRTSLLPKRQHKRAGDVPEHRRGVMREPGHGALH